MTPTPGWDSIDVLPILAHFWSNAELQLKVRFQCSDANKLRKRSFNHRFQDLTTKLPPQWKLYTQLGSNLRDLALPFSEHAVAFRIGNKISRHGRRIIAIIYRRNAQGHYDIVDWYHDDPM
jgi:hypothetical protein